MIKKMYISDRNRPCLVNYLDDCIYDLKNDVADDYLEVDGIKKGLYKESMVSTCENNCIDKLRRTVNEADIIKNAYSDWRNKQTELKTKQNEIKMINVLHEFFNTWARLEKIRCTPHPIYEFPNEIAEARTIDFNRFKLNETNEQSILKQRFMPNSESLFFISGKCYKLVKYDNQPSAIRLNKKKFSLQYVSSLEEFDTAYFDEIQKKFEEKIRKLAIADSEQLKEVDRKYKELEQELKIDCKDKLDCKESGIKLGFIRKNGQTFLYISHESYKMTCDDVEYGWFPKFKVGVRINVKNGKYSYDFNGRTRPVVLDHDYYEHPAVYGLEPGKEEKETFKNPSICVLTCGYNYPSLTGEFTENEKGKLIAILYELFKRLSNIIEYDKNATVPHRLPENNSYIRYDPVFLKYKNLGVPKK
jgi:hypothetical protein